MQKKESKKEANCARPFGNAKNATKMQKLQQKSKQTPQDPSEMGEKPKIQTNPARPITA